MVGGTTSSITSRDGVALLTRRWPAAGVPCARMLIVHGIAEHSGLYEVQASRFAAAGIDVHAFDLRGFGGSGGRRAFVRRWDDYLGDVEDVLAALPRDLPLVMLGHSMGGLIGLSYAVSDRPRPDLLVLSSPALDARVPPALRAIGPVLSRLVPTLMVPNPIRPEQLSRDPAIGQAYLADPLVILRTTTRLGAEMFAAMDRLPASLGRLTVRTLVIHGADDTLVPAASSEPLAALPGVDRRLYPGLCHETMLEPEGPAVVADVVAWIRREVAVHARGDARPAGALAAR